MRSRLDVPEPDGSGGGMGSNGIISAGVRRVSAASSGRMTGLGRVTAGFNPVARSR